MNLFQVIYFIPLLLVTFYSLVNLIAKSPNSLLYQRNIEIYKEAQF